MIGLLTFASMAALTPAVEPSVLIVEFEPSYVGIPVGCENPETICLAELYEGPMRVLQHLSGPSIQSGQILRYSRHGQYIKPRVRLVVAVRPFEDNGTKGYFAFWWERPVEPGKYCVTVDQFKSWSAEDPVRRVFSTAKVRHFQPAGWDESDDFHCITN